MVKHLFGEILDDRATAGAIQHHDVDIGIRSQFTSTVSPHGHQTTVLHARGRIAAPLPHHASISADQDRIHEGGKIRDDFRPGRPFAQSPEHASTARIENGLRGGRTRLRQIRCLFHAFLIHRRPPEPLPCTTLLISSYTGLNIVSQRLTYRLVIGIRRSFPSAFCVILIPIGA